MTSPVPTRARLPARRRSPGWVPNQHGAWVMLATPLLVGIVASRPQAVHLPLTAFLFVGYLAFFALGLWLKSRRKSRYLPPVRAYGLLSALLGVLTLVLDPGLARWAPLFLVPLGVGLVASATRTERSLVSGLSTAIGSCLMAVVAYDAGGGTDWARIWTIAAVLAAYFGGTVVYVKTMIRERGSRAHYLLSLAWHALASVAMVAVSMPLTVIFVLLTVRAANFPRLGLSPKQVGLIEIAATFAVALAALAMPG